DIAAGRENQPLLAFGHLGELGERLTAILGLHSSAEHDQVLREGTKPAGEVFEMILSLRQYDGRATFDQGVDDVLQDELVPELVCRQRRVDLLDRRLSVGIGQSEAGLPNE